MTDTMTVKYSKTDTMTVKYSKTDTMTVKYSKRKKKKQIKLNRIKKRQNGNFIWMPSQESPEHHSMSFNMQSFHKII